MTTDAWAAVAWGEAIRGSLCPQPARAELVRLRGNLGEIAVQRTERGA